MGPGFATVVEQGHVCQSVTVVDMATTLQDLRGDKDCSVKRESERLGEWQREQYYQMPLKHYETLRPVITHTYRPHHPRAIASHLSE